MKADYVALVDLILSRNHFVDVWTGGAEPDVNLSQDRAEILMAIESVEMAEIKVWAIDDSLWAIEDSLCESIYEAFWAMIIPFGVAPDETVADYTDNGYWLEEIAL